MQRWLAMAVLGAVLLSTPVWGQRGGRGGMPAGGAGRSGFVAHGGGGFSHGPVNIGGPSGGWRHPPYGNPYHYRYPYYPGRYPYGWGYPWAFGYGYGAYSYPGGGFAWDVGDSYSSAAPAYPTDAYTYPDISGAYAQNSQIQQDEIDRLSHEVDRLRDEQSSPVPQNAVPQPKARIHAETLLVFRDKHTEEIQNYAIVGNTLWVFTELRARKIPIASLDVLATTRANDDRGIDFRLPK